MHIYVDVVPYMTSKEAALRVARRTRPLTNPARAILAVVRTASALNFIIALGFFKIISTILNLPPQKS